MNRFRILKHNKQLKKHTIILKKQKRIFIFKNKQKQKLIGSSYKNE